MVRPRLHQNSSRINECEGLHIPHCYSFAGQCFVVHLGKLSRIDVHELLEDRNDEIGSRPVSRMPISQFEFNVMQ